MTNAAYADAVTRLHHGIDPYADFPHRLYGVDGQGWNSQHPFLRRSVEETRPRIVVEMGVWKGGSTIELAAALRDSGIDGVVIAIDTWLGSSELRLDPATWAELCPRNGFPGLYWKFLSNVVHAGLAGHVVPFAIDSANAAICLAETGLLPDLIHLDGAHDYDAVSRDLRLWWPLLADGGTFVFDDYDEAGVAWPSVRRAVADFLAGVPHARFENAGMKARVTKAAA